MGSDTDVGMRGQLVKALVGVVVVPVGALPSSFLSVLLLLLKDKSWKFVQ